MIVIMEDIYDQILQHNILKDDHFFKHRAQTALKAFTYNYLDLDIKGFFNLRLVKSPKKQLNLICLLSILHKTERKFLKAEGTEILKKSEMEKFIKRNKNGGH